MAKWGRGGRVVTLSPPTSEIRVWFPALTSSGKGGSYLLTDGRQFTLQKIDQLYVLVSSALPTTRRGMTYAMC